MAAFKEYDRYDGLGLAGLVSSGEVSAADLCEEAIARIGRVNPRLNAVITPMFEQGRTYIPNALRPCGRRRSSCRDLVTPSRNRSPVTTETCWPGVT